MLRQLAFAGIGLVGLVNGIEGQSRMEPFLGLARRCNQAAPIIDAKSIYQQVLMFAVYPVDPSGISFFQEMVRAWLGNNDPEAQAFAVRALGRLERPELISSLVPVLSSSWPEVRKEAANALGQSVQGASAAERPRVAGEAAAALRARLEKEEEGAVRAVIYETLGRLTYADAGAAQLIEKILAEAIRSEAPAPGNSPGAARLAARLGAVKGMEALLRQQVRLFTPSEETIARLRALALAGGNTGSSAAQDDDARRVRRLALLALGPHGKADEKTLAGALEDKDWEVRRIAMRLAGAGLGTAASAAKESRLALIRRGLKDADWQVRYEALSAFTRNQDIPECAPILTATGDRATHVALLAIDQSPKCKGAAVPDVIRSLRGFLGTLSASVSPQAGNKAPAWHRAAHALVAAAAAAPDLARTELRRFQSHPVWQVRMYAARAAAILKEAAALRALAGDPDDNVRNAAVAGLVTVEQHGADDLYIAQLARSDEQLLMTASRALRGSKNAAALPALLGALDNRTRLARSTNRDARLALLERIGELGSAEQTAALEPLLRDPDPRVGASAAAILTRWTKTAVEPAAPRQSGGGLSIRELRQLDGSLAEVQMRRGGSFTLALLTWETPETAASFARLAECGYYNGLTFHRVEPNFVIQGGSPGANEYAGYAHFMRDEVGLASNRRGTVGLSTRGRHTADGQWYVNLADNARLDHNYTVFATVVRGMDVVDSILEGDEIAAVRIIPRK